MHILFAYCILYIFIILFCFVFYFILFQVINCLKSEVAYTHAATGFIQYMGVIWVFGRRIFTGFTHISDLLPVVFKP